MKNLTQEQIIQAQKDISAYLDLCPANALKHINENMEGFIAGWLARAAFENDKKES